MCALDKIDPHFIRQEFACCLFDFRHIQVFSNFQCARLGRAVGHDYCGPVLICAGIIDALVLRRHIQSYTAAEYRIALNSQDLRYSVRYHWIVRKAVECFTLERSICISLLNKVLEFFFCRVPAYVMPDRSCLAIAVAGHHITECIREVEHEISRQAREGRQVAQVFLSIAAIQAKGYILIMIRYEIYKQAGGKVLFGLVQPVLDWSSGIRF